MSSQFTLTLKNLTWKKKTRRFTLGHCPECFAFTQWTTHIPKEKQTRISYYIDFKKRRNVTRTNFFKVFFIIFSGVFGRVTNRFSSNLFAQRLYCSPTAAHGLILRQGTGVCETVTGSNLTARVVQQKCTCTAAYMYVLDNFQPFCKQSRANGGVRRHVSESRASNGSLLDHFFVAIVLKNYRNTGNYVKPDITVHSAQNWAVTTALNLVFTI